MGFSYNISHKKENLSEIYINYSANIPESFTDKIYNSIVKIKMSNENFATGFFMKVYIEKEELKLFVTCNHIIPQKYFDQKLSLPFFYGKKNEEIKKSILLDKNKRLIINYTSPTDIILIQIIDDDNIPKDKFLMVDYNYLNGFETYENKDFCTAGYPNSYKGERCISFGKILNINYYNNYEFEHSLEEKYCSISSPICLLENNCIIGIHRKIDKNKNTNYGTFIGIVFQQLEKEYQKYKQQIKNKKENNKQKEEIVITKEKKLKEIDKLDYIIQKDCKPNEDYYRFFNSIKNPNNLSYLINASIFDKSKYDEIKGIFLTKFQKNYFNELEKASIGSLLGLAIGDAIGARVEFTPLNYEYNRIKDMGTFPEGKFKLKPGQWTDNTSLGLCIADSLIEKDGEFDPRDIMMRFILWWLCGYNNAFRFDNKRGNKTSVGLYGNSKESLIEYINNKGKYIYTNNGDINSSGNGSLIRNAAIPICFYKDEKKAIDSAKKQSLITHKGYEAAGCCQLLTYIIVKILNLKEKSKSLNPKTEIKKITLTFNKKQENIRYILNNLKEFSCDYNSVNYLANSLQEGNDKKRDWNWKKKDFKYSEERAKKSPSTIGSYCMDGLAMALHVLYTTDNFKDAILKVVNLCGDSGAVGSIVGQIAGAYYGLDSIPKEWINKINEWDKNEIALRAYILSHLNEKQNFS